MTYGLQYATTLVTDRRKDNEVYSMRKWQKTVGKTKKKLCYFTVHGAWILYGGGHDLFRSEF